MIPPERLQQFAECDGRSCPPPPSIDEFVSREFDPSVRDMPSINESPEQFRAYLEKCNVKIRDVRVKDGITYLFPSCCPFHADHGQGTDTAFVFGTGGRLGFKCQHDRCANFGWKEARRQIDPDWARFERLREAQQGGTGTNGVAVRSGDDDDSPLTSVHAPSWPDPADEAAFYGLAGDIVRAIEPHTEADPMALLLDILICFGNAIGRSAFFRADGAQHFGNLFGVLVGDTSKGRKGTSRSQIDRLFRQIAGPWASDHVQSGLSTGEGLIWAVRDPIYKVEQIRERGKVTGETQETLADPGVSDKRLLVIETEFASVLRRLEREGNTLSATVRQAWETGNLRIMNKNSPAKASGAHISILAHITNEELRRHLNMTETANGFANRHIWICVRRSKCLPEGGHIEEVDFTVHLKRLENALEFGASAREIRRDGEAREIWHAVYPELSEGKPGLFGAVVSRAEAQVMRLSMLYALLDCSPVIAPKHVHAALAVWDYAEASARFIFGDSLGDPVADELLRVLKDAGEKGMSRTEIRDHYRRHKSATEIDRALSVLVRNALVRLVTYQTLGRSVERWFAVVPGATKATKATEGGVG